MALQGHWATSELVSPLRTWTHFCFTYNQASSQWTMYLDREKRAQGTFPKATSPVPSGGAFIIGESNLHCLISLILHIVLSYLH